MEKIIFSGIRPSGELHIGNYLGALKNWVTLQNKPDNRCIFCIVDYHAITTPFEPKEMKDKIFNTAVDYLAAGLDPKKSIIFVQSHVPEHTELAWILNTITPVGELKRMTQFKEKSQLHKENVNMGLFDYPVLMAADILIYQTDLVPVGEDQYQHVELARTIARKFNNTFGEFFKVPEIYRSIAPRVMSLTDPAKKMEKSMGPNSYIALRDEPETIKQKIQKAVSDSGGGDKKNSGGKNLLDLLKLLAPTSTDLAKFEKQYKKGELKYSELKPILAKTIIDYLANFRTKRKELLKNPEKVWAILNEGGKKAQTIAAKNLTTAKQKIGLI